MLVSPYRVNIGNQHPVKVWEKKKHENNMEMGYLQFRIKYFETLQ